MTYDMRGYLEDKRRADNEAKDRKEEKLDTLLTFVCGFVTMVAFLLGFWFFSGALAEEEPEEGWILCMPDSEVNIRARASKHSEAVGRLYLGDMILIDKRSGNWVHAVSLPCEAGEGWIKKDFVDEWEPTVYVQGVKARTVASNVNARYSIGGKLRKRLKKGAEVTVWAESADVAVTSQGYVKPEYLERIVEVAAE